MKTHQHFNVACGNCILQQRCKEIESQVLMFSWNYLKTDVVSCEVVSVYGHGRTVDCATSGICCVVPCNGRVEITLTFQYYVCLGSIHHHLFPATRDIKYI